LNLHRIRVATDCQNVVRSLEERSLGRYAHVIQEVLAARSDFDELSFSFERRVLNKEAHNLARSVVFEEYGRRVWFVDPPEGLCIPVRV
jgi:hypothetical protein